VEASECSPRRGDDAAQRVRGVAAVGLGGLDHARDFADRALCDRVDQGIAGGEVDVDRRPDGAGPASDPGHAGIRVARQCVERCVQDPGPAALGVGASARRTRRRRVAGGRHLWLLVDGHAGREPQAWQGAPGRGQDRREQAGGAGARFKTASYTPGGFGTLDASHVGGNPI
jgi:hypothetical protein